MIKTGVPFIVDFPSSLKLIHWRYTAGIQPHPQPGITSTSSSRRSVPTAFGPWPIWLSTTQSSSEALLSVQSRSSRSSAIKTCPISSGPSQSWATKMKKRLSKFWSCLGRGLWHFHHRTEPKLHCSLLCQFQKCSRYQDQLSGSGFHRSFSGRSSHAFGVSLPAGPDNNSLVFGDHGASRWRLLEAGCDGAAPKSSTETIASTAYVQHILVPCCWVFPKISIALSLSHTIYIIL